MLRIPGAELFSDFRIGVLPEAAEVLRYGEWPSCRRKQVYAHWRCSVTDAGCFGQSKKFLQFHRKRGVTRSTVFKGDA